MLGYNQNPPFFQDLRVLSPWEPKFYVNDSLYDAAFAINRPHEDFPNKVIPTANAIRHTVGYFRKYGINVSNNLLNQIHRYVFPKFGYASGSFRQINVIVGHHLPPKYELIDNLMSQLEECYKNVDLSVESHLINWYSDFETIHPYVDGNGRVGGIIVASSILYV